MLRSGRGAAFPVPRSSAASLRAILAVPGYAQDTTITIGIMSWEDLTPISGITKTVPQAMGFTVEVEEFSECGIAFAALTKGDIDIMAHDFWTKNMDKLEKISPVSHGLYQAIAVPTYVTLGGLDERAANADKFGGKIIGIEPGSGLMRDAANAVDACEMEIELVERSTAGRTAALETAMSRNEWIAGTVWEPSWMMHKGDVKFLAYPKAVFPDAQSDDWIGTAGFSAANPAACGAITLVPVPLADITATNGAMNQGKTMPDAVADWTAAHTDLIGRWTAIRSP